MVLIWSHTLASSAVTPPPETLFTAEIAATAAGKIASGTEAAKGANQLNLLFERAKIIWKFAVFEIRECFSGVASPHSGSRE